LQIQEFPVNTVLINLGHNKIGERSKQNSINPNQKDRGLFKYFSRSASNLYYASVINLEGSRTKVLNFCCKIIPYEVLHQICYKIIPFVEKI